MRLWAPAALGLALMLGLGAPPAQAQFMCDNDLGGEFGDGATAAGGSNVACGTNANASGAGSNNTAFGRQATAVGDGSGNTASGDTANASGNTSDNTASGASANASGANSSNTASGFGAIASGDFSTNAAFGRTANASGDDSSNTASGASANASGVNSRNTASGVLANASGDDSFNIAIGSSANASGSGTRNTAVGANSVATGANASAFGNGAQATHANATAIGNGAVTSRADQQVFGTATNTYTMAGIASAASAAAQSGPRQIVTSDANGNLAASSLDSLGLASAGDLAGINSRLDDLSSRSGKAYAGIAMAFAMAGVPTVLPNETFVTTLNWGTFQGSHGFAVSSAYRIGNNMQLNGGIAMSPNQSLFAGRAGVRFGW